MILYVNSYIMILRRFILITLSYALLGLLAIQPFSGYDIAQKLRRPVGLFWQAKHSQIYPELARLEAANLVTHEIVEQADRPDKKVYKITGAGLAALRKWVSTPVEMAPMRDELILKAFCLWLAEPAQAIALFKHEEQRHREQMAFYEKTLAEGKAEVNPAVELTTSPPFGSYLTLNWGIRYEREYAEWCGWVAEQLEKGVN